MKKILSKFHIQQLGVKKSFDGLSKFVSFLESFSVLWGNWICTCFLHKDHRSKEANEFDTL